MFDKQAVLEGQRIRNEMKETPSNFMKDSSAANVSGNPTRMAGDRIAEMQDPVEGARLAKWMEEFEVGNMSRMNKGLPAAG